MINFLTALIGFCSACLRVMGVVMMVAILYNIIRVHEWKKGLKESAVFADDDFEEAKSTSIDEIISTIAKATIPPKRDSVCVMHSGFENVTYLGDNTTFVDFQRFGNTFIMEIRRYDGTVDKFDWYVDEGENGLYCKELEIKCTISRSPLFSCSISEYWHTGFLTKMKSKNLEDFMDGRLDIRFLYLWEIYKGCLYFLEHVQKEET